MSSPIASASSSRLDAGSVPQFTDESPAADELDEVAAAAVELARAAAEDVAEPGTVGRHLGVRGEGPGLVLHTFESLARGYRGWQWAVSLAHVAGSDDVTVCDSVLLPGDESVLSPQWVPWSDRLAPGDLGPGDELPYREDDPLLVPGFTDPDDEDQVQVWELGLGRVRVLGREGRAEAAQRWYAGSPGPSSEVALQAPAPCMTCGYFVPLSGSLRLSFGVCANEWSPSDASVVSVDHGCGAHSETDLAPVEPDPIADRVVDDGVLDVLELEPEPEAQAQLEAETQLEGDAQLEAEAEPEAEADPEGATVAEPVAEPVVIDVVEPEPEPLVTVAGVDEPADVIEPAQLSDDEGQLSDGEGAPPAP